MPLAAGGGWAQFQAFDIGLRSEAGGDVEWRGMRRVRRWMFNALAALSLVLCVGSVTLWVRSYWRADEFSIERTRKWKLMDDSGIFNWSVLREYPAQATLDAQRHFGHFVRAGPDEAVASVVRFEHRSGEPSGWTVRWMMFRVTFGREKEDIGVGGRVLDHGRISLFLERSGPNVTIPAWSFVFAFAVSPGVWVVRLLGRRRMERRVLEGCCGECGYDLRGSPGRCPECGSIRIGEVVV